MMNAKREWIFAIAALAACTIFLATTQQAHASPASVRATIVSEGHRAHLSAVNISALVTLARRESSLNPRAANGSCLGVFQLGSGVRTRAARDSRWRWWNVAHNTWSAIGYMKWRYGTPDRALAHSYAYGWY